METNVKEWELETVGALDCQMDDTTGVYTVINRVVIPGTHKGIAGERIEIRVDVMSADDEPVRSFQGLAHDVRIRVARFLSEYRPETSLCHLSYEHAAYIGAEIQRAETDSQYVQS